MRFELPSISGFKVVGVDRAGQLTDISSIVKRVEWSSTLEEAGVRGSIDVSDADKDYIKIGERFYLYGPNPETKAIEEITRITTFTKGKTSDLANGWKASGYDMMVYLLKNEDDFIFYDASASDIATALCKGFGVPIGSIADTGYHIPKLIERKKTPYDLIVKALVKTREATGRKFFLRMRGDKLYLEEKKATPLVWVIEEGGNLISADYSESIEDLRNYVKVYGHADEGERNPVLYETSDRSSITRFGLMQAIRQADEDAEDGPSAKTIGDTILKKLNKVSLNASVSSFGIVGLMAGDPVYVIDQKTGLLGVFYVGSATHIVEGGVHKMNLELRWDDDIADPDPEIS